MNVLKAVGGIILILVIWATINVWIQCSFDKKNEGRDVVEKIVIDLEVQDSLLNAISILEDSLSKKKTERINQIDTVYEEAINNIRNLNPTKQIELLTRNLSQTSRD